MVENEQHKIYNRYFLWLNGLVDYNLPNHYYIKINQILFRKKFKAFLGLDGNRIEDGKALRERYIEETKDLHCPQHEEPCSVFELLVALAIRMDYILSNKTDLTGKWYSLFIENLGISEYAVNQLDDPLVQSEIEQIINKFIERRYDNMGRGGIFPLQFPLGNQRRLEIWYQMMDYIEENAL